MADIVTRRELENAKIDARDLGEAVNEKVIVSPRYGDDFKSLPMLATEAQSSIIGWDEAIRLITYEDGVPALAVSDASGKTQQQVNDYVKEKTLNLLDFFTPTELNSYRVNYKSVDIKDAFDRAVFAANSLGVKLTAYGKFYTVSTNYLYCDADLSAATLEYNLKTGVALRIANLTESVLSRKDIKAFKVVNLNKVSADNWAGLTNTGVQTVNLNSCNLYIPYAVDFAVGLHKYATNDSGNCYSTITLGQIQNNKINILFSTDQSNAWVNENSFFGGRLGYLSAEGNAVTGTRQVKIEASPNVINNNRFFGSSLEGDVPEYTVENSGTSNLFFFCRWEATTPKVLYHKDTKGGALTNTANQATRNTINGGYQSDSIQEIRLGSGGSFLNSKIGQNISIRPMSSSTGGDRYQNTSSNASPFMSAYPTASNISDAELSEATFKVSALSLACKGVADAYDRIQLSFSNGRIYLGNGSVDATSYVYGTPSGIYSSGNIMPLPSNDSDLGSSTSKWSQLYLKNGFGVFGATPPTTKRSITGKKAPTTITEQNAVIDSIVAALVAYGLVSDDRTT